VVVPVATTIPAAGAATAVPATTVITVVPDIPPPPIIEELDGIILDDPDEINVFEPEDAIRFVSKELSNLLYIRGSLIVCIFYQILAILGSRAESIRATQMPNVFGFNVIWIWKIVANVYFHIEYYKDDHQETDQIDFVFGR
jgi:hypothetical protein